MGLLDDLAKDAIFIAAVQASKDKNGKPDPYKAAGLIAGAVQLSLVDQARLGAILGSQGAFADESRSFDELDYIEPRFTDIAANDPDSEKHAWRDDCNDGFDFSIDPGDYETEEEYEDALEVAKYFWRDSCNVDFENGLDPYDYETEEEYKEALAEAEARKKREREKEETNEEIITFPISFSIEIPALDRLEAIKESDYPNKRKYLAAYTLANEFIFYSDPKAKKLKETKCHFILDNPEILAASYLSVSGGFQYALAVKEHFDLQIQLPDEDEDGAVEMELETLLCEIAEKDMVLAVEIWDWCIDQFMPYIEFDDFHGRKALTSFVFDKLDDMPEGFKSELVKHINQHPEFSQKVIRDAPSLPYDISGTIFCAIKDGFQQVARLMFEDVIANKSLKGTRKLSLAESVVYECKTYEELESMEVFEKQLLPILKTLEGKNIKKGIVELEKNIADYYLRVEEDCEQYAYSRRNVWRNNVPDGTAYGLNPVDYSSEKNYLEAYENEQQIAREREQQEQRRTQQEQERLLFENRFGTVNPVFKVNEPETLYKEFVSCLGENLVTGDHNANGLLQKTLLEIINTNPAIGLQCWHELIGNFNYVRRSQDFTSHMLRLLKGENGLAWTLEYIESDPRLEERLFCDAGSIPDDFIRELIGCNKQKPLKKYLNMLIKNTHAKRVSLSKNLNDYLDNQPILHKYIKKSTFCMKHFVYGIEWLYFIPEKNGYKNDSVSAKTLSILDDWRKTAVEKWTLYNDNWEFEEITPCRYVQKKIITPFVPPVPQSDIGPGTSLANNILNNYFDNLSFDVTSVDNVIDNISSLADAISRTNSLDCYLTAFPIRMGKKGGIARFIAEQFADMVMIPPLIFGDDTLNCICGISKPEKNDLVCLSLNNVNSFTIWETSNQELQIFNTNLSALCKYITPTDNASIEYYSALRIAKPIPKSIVEKAASQIHSQYNDEEIMRIFNALNTLLLPELTVLVNNRNDTINKLMKPRRIDEIASYVDGIYQYLVDIGEMNVKWISEMKMFTLIKAHFPDAKYQARPQWLSRQSYDVFIPSEKLAFEYQGKQHYEAVEHFGGETSFVRQVELDKKKRQLSVENNVVLIEWKFDEPLNELTLKNKLKLYFDD